MRRQHDAYFTPGWATEQLVARVPMRGTILEPCVGQHAIAHVIRRRHEGRLITNDLNPSCRADLHEDAAHVVLWQKVNARRGVDWIATNPPFMVAFEIFRYALAHARRGVAMLLRLSILEPTNDRGVWLEEHPPTRLIVLPRISFTGDGNTDSVTCGWFIWEHDAVGTIEIISKRTLINEHAPSLLEVVA